MDHLDRTAGRTSSFYLKPWPVRIFEDFPYSLYIVAASESDEGFVWLGSMLSFPDIYLSRIDIQVVICLGGHLSGDPSKG